MNRAWDRPAISGNSEKKLKFRFLEHNTQNFDIMDDSFARDAILKNDTSALKTWLDEREDFFFEVFPGDTRPLLVHFAAERGSAEALDVLWQHANLLDKNGKTPCAVAAAHGHAAAAERLLELGAKLPPCHVAIHHWSTFELLVARGADWRGEFDLLCERAGDDARADDRVVDFLLAAQVSPAQQANQTTLALKKNRVAMSAIGGQR